MSRHMSHKILLSSVIGFVSMTGSAYAQYYGYGGGDPCGCVQPVAQACYQTVPVTEYRQVRQTVQRPVVETEYQDQHVTEYRPVTEQRTANIPTVTYDNVTEMHTVYKDAGYWQSHCQCNPKLSPCQYDNRPTFTGWLNRTGYSIRSAFTPRYSVKRQYVPQTVAQQVPVTRQVARHGTRQVAYNVTRYEPHHTTRKVAVNKVKYVAEEVVTNQPVTVMRTVPIGSSVAYQYSPYGASSQTALQPSPDGIGGGPARSADSSNAEKYNRDATNIPAKPNSDNDTSLMMQEPAEQEVQPASFETTIEPQAQHDTTFAPGETRITRRIPSVVQAHGWAARQTSSAAPMIVAPSVSLADSKR